MLKLNKTAKTLLTGMAMMAAMILPAAAQDKVDLTFAHFLAPERNEGPNIVAAIERFKKKFPNVTLTQQISGHDEYLQQFKVGAASGEVPDIFMINTGDLTGIVGAGLISDIKADLAADPEWGDSIQPAMIKELSRGEGTYSVPYGQIVTHLIYWNEDLFKAAGIDSFPQDWKGFMAAIAALKESGVTPISLGNKGRWVVVDPYMGTLSQRMHGDGFIEGLYDGTRKFTDDDFVASVAKLDELVKAGAFNEDMNSIDNSQQRDPYFQGEAAMFIEGSWAIPKVTTDSKPDVLKATRIAIWPKIEGGKGAANQVTAGAGWSFAISPKLEGDARAAAIGLIKELSNAEYGRSRLAIGLLPAQILKDTSGIDVHRLLATVSERLADGTYQAVPIFNNVMPSSYLDVAGQEFQDLMVGNKTPEDVAAALQDDFDRSK